MTTVCRHSEPTFATIGWQGRPVRLEYRWVGAMTSEYPVVVFLHEGLGSIGLWKDFPHQFCARHGLKGLVFSRYGYGSSTPRPPEERWPVSFMHVQAYESLPTLLSALDVNRPWLFGHSDGGSIALLYASRFPDAVSGIVVAAPHIFVEDLTIKSIEQAKETYLSTDLRAKLSRYHADPDSAFWGWNNIWLDPAFREWNIEASLPNISCPALAIQGEEDEYGTLEQIYGIQRKVPHTQLCVLSDCGHSPHRDQPEIVIREAGRFILCNS